MTNSVASAERFRRYARAALAEGFDEVVLFAPNEVDLVQRHIRGCVYRKDGTWRRQVSPFPNINIDIGYYISPRNVRNAIRVKNMRSMPFTGYGLGNKWKIQQHLMESLELAPHLLPTAPMKAVPDILAFLEQHKVIMLKPINGKGGQGIIRLSASLSAADGKPGKVGYHVKNNDSKLTFSTRNAVAVYLRRIMMRGPHLMQQWIDIRNTQGQVYDIRALVQKDGKGSWQLAGLAVREGQRNKITSNLKTGGQAYEASAYLKSQFGEERGSFLTESARALAAHIPLHLEASYGIRLSELGIDLAVDRDGRLWLLEVNIKPGRQVIQRVYGPKAYQQCFKTPFLYARYLLRSRDGETAKPG
jgi:glutathione synthase/RimK-type ligase-like ATP-grasp enzyme